MKARILMLDKHDEEKEIEFEIDYLMSLTIKQRFKKLFGLLDFVIKLSKRYGNNRTTNRTTAEITQRK